MEIKENKMNRKDREVRSLAMNLREETEPEKDDGFIHIEGKAISFDSPTLLYPKEWGYADKDVYEVMDNTVLDKADVSDIVLNVNHGDGNYAVARTRNETLAIQKKEDGVYIEAKLNKKNQRCLQFAEDVSEGLLDRMSFAFTIDDEDTEEKSDCYVIHVKSIKKIYDVSAVEFPQYSSEGDTFISEARSENLGRLKEEAKVRKEVRDMKEDIMKKVDAALKSGETEKSEN